MSQISMYAGYESVGGIKFRVYVHSDVWYSLDKGRKEFFAQRAYQVKQLCGLDYPEFEVMTKETGRRVGSVK